MMYLKIQLVGRKVSSGSTVLNFKINYIYISFYYFSYTNEILHKTFLELIKKINFMKFKNPTSFLINLVWQNNINVSNQAVKFVLWQWAKELTEWT